MNTEKETPDVTFDTFAENYNAVHRKNLGVFGKDIDVFARYKVQLTAKLLSFSPKTIFEFGCGIGKNLPFFRQLFPNALLYCSDISDLSLQKASENLPGLICFNSSLPEALAPFSETFDLVFLSCVLHHIPLQERQTWVNALARTVRPGGCLIIFEHNPWNPATRYLVSTCPFDKGVSLVRPKHCFQFLKQSGLQVDRIRYTLIFPWRNSAFVAVEAFLDRIPLGGQYCVLARKPLYA